jgi:ABC-type multidrug transport system ATPase subunit/uncharacterized tellurite resistance protein B-like protein
MSELILKAIIRLFAVVARQDGVTELEREQIKTFLKEHIAEGMIEYYLALFDEYTKPGAHSTQADTHTLQLECDEINRGLTQKQKVIIVLELERIVLADDKVSAREEELMHIICESFKVKEEDLTSIRQFVVGQEASELDHEALLIIDAHEDKDFAHAKHIRKPHLKGLIEVLYIQQAELYFMKYIGRGDVYLNSAPIKTGTINVLAVGSALRWDKDDPVYYGDVLSKFKKFGDGSKITFEAKGIDFKFKNGKLGLRNVNLAEESGNLIALMGASGSGKSTLLHVLNGSETPSKGQVLINGVDIHREPWRIEGVIGFVPQDDLIIEDLTVYQNLYFAAKLCFNDKTEEEIDELVLKVLEDLGLSETKNLKVGSPLRKTISGGQRKRLNIGLELLREPSVLFCDEPTSGLSSRDSENIIDLLKELSLKGKLVFTVIHQPSSDIFKKFDKLVILDTGGYQIYYGNPVDSIVYFKRSINLINSDEGECNECGNVNPEQIFNIIETKVINEYGHFTPERKITAEQWNKIYDRSAKNVSVEPVEEVLKSTLQIPARLKQAQIFGMRDIQAKIHNTQYMVINLLEAPLLAFILAFIVRYYNVDDKLMVGYVYGKNLNLPAYLFMSVIVALFMGLTVSAEEIIRDRKILKREAFLHLSRSSYLLSKISILFALSAIQTMMFVLLGNYILGIQGMFFEHWAILFTVSCFANVLGLNISSAFNSAVTIYILIPILLIPQLILSGVVVKFDKLNPAIGNTSTVPFVGDIMASRWGFETAMVTQFKDNKFEQVFYEDDRTMANSDYKKVYFIPELETRLQYCLVNYASQDESIKGKVKNDLELLYNEIHREAAGVGATENDILFANALTPSKFDSTVSHQTSEFLIKLKRVYMNRYNDADARKEAKIEEMTNTPEKEIAFEHFKATYHNEVIADLVKNLSETHRSIEKDGKLIQKIYPVYKDPDPDHTIDFTAQFYMPKKHFLGRNIDTFYFNLGVIWSMSLVLGIALYLDVLRRIIDGIGSLSKPA